MDQVGTQLGRVFERKYAEDDQSRFFTVSRDLVGVAGPDGYFKHVNPAWERILGFTIEEVLSRPFLDFVHPEDRERTVERFQLVLAGEATNAFENRYVCKDGSVKWILWNAVPTPGGELVYASGHDITERKRIEQERERLLDKEQDQVERLRELDRLKDDFVASVSHELRTPLTSIQGYLELALDKSFGGDLLTDDQRSFLAVVERNSDRLQRLVADLLFVAQVDAGALVLERTEVDVAEVARECVEAARPVAEEKGIELAWVGEPPPPVSGDRARLGQLLDNLVSNALKFTPEGGRVEVKTASANGEAVIEVEDTGSVSRPRSRSGCSSASFAPPTRPSGRSRGPVSASRSPRRSWRRTTAASRSRAPRAAARPSRCTFRSLTRSRSSAARRPNGRNRAAASCRRAGSPGPRLAGSAILSSR